VFIYHEFIYQDGWTTADLVFLWKEGDPVQVVKNLHLPRFTLEKFLTDYCNSKTNTGEIMMINCVIWRNYDCCCFKRGDVDHLVEKKEMKDEGIKNIYL